jgi:hypothetical protein
MEDPTLSPMRFHTAPFLVEDFTDPHNRLESHGSNVVSLTCYPRSAQLIRKLPFSLNCTKFGTHLST